MWVGNFPIFLLLIFPFASAAVLSLYPGYMIKKRLLLLLPRINQGRTDGRGGEPGSACSELCRLGNNC